MHAEEVLFKFCPVHNFKTFIEVLHLARMYGPNTINQEISVNKIFHRNSIKNKLFDKMRHKC